MKVTLEEQELVAILRDPDNAEYLVVAPCKLGGIDTAVIAYKGDKEINPIAVLINPDLFKMMEFASENIPPTEVHFQKG